MSDLIDRQATLNAICGILTHGQALECERRINALPSAQLKTQLSEEDATSDCISRKAALDALEWKWAGKAAFDAIKALPPAQPEVIRCKDCYHYPNEFADCPMIGWARNENDFCSKAERNNDD